MENFIFVQCKDIFKDIFHLKVSRSYDDSAISDQKLVPSIYAPYEVFNVDSWRS